MRVIGSTVDLQSRAIAFALVARSLGRDPSALLDREHLAAIRTRLHELERSAATDRLADFDIGSLPTLDELEGRWVRWFDIGRIAPYEGSNVVVTAGGITPRLADIAGFYRAFGMTVPGDRPDHVVAELEFLALALLHEADALAGDDVERLDVIGDVIRSFLRDHIGTWIDAWAARIADVPELDPWAPFAAIAADLVAREAQLRNVIPARTDAVLTNEIDVPDDTAPLLECGGDDVIDR